jgi:dihydrofolate reductase
LPHSTRAPEPLGKGGEQLHDWVVATRSWRQTHAKQGGETGPNDEIADEHFQNIGASIMGRHMFGGGTGPWPTNPPRKGSWGDNPPFHHPVFVLTHHPRKPLEMQGGDLLLRHGRNPPALEQAKKAAHGKDVSLGGGADVAQQ